jgi:hypothetical protein
MKPDNVIGIKAITVGLVGIQILTITLIMQI